MRIATTLAQCGVHFSHSHFNIFIWTFWNQWLNDADAFCAKNDGSFSSWSWKKRGGAVRRGSGLN